MISIKTIEDIHKLTPQDILDVFKETRVFKITLNKVWEGRTDIKKRFVNPLEFLEGISKDIADAINAPIDEDYWLLILGEPGTGKSTLSIALYKYIMKYLGYTNEQIKDNIYLDVCYLPYDYLGRINLHSKQIQERGQIFPYPIVLDEAHNMFDLFAEGATGTARKILQRIFEIREFRLAHIINTQIPRQLASRARERFHSLIILWKEPIYIGEGSTPLMEKLYLDYTKNILKKDLGEGNIGYFLWGAYYNKEMTHTIMRWIIRHQINIEELRSILRKFTPDFFFPMLLLLHESTELRKVYSEIKLYNNTIKALYDTFGIKGSNRATFLKILVELSKNIDNIKDKKDAQGNYIVSPPISVRVDNEKIVDSLQYIGNVSKEHIIEESSGGDEDIKVESNYKHIKKIIHEEWYIKVKSIHPDIYFFIKNNHHILERRSKLHAAAGYHL
jgi:energy-coupling factor transporter ATP-binding protein EcfA2